MAQAQETAATAPPPVPLTFPGYDVISVKPNVSGSGSIRMSARDSTLLATNISLKMLLADAYGIRQALVLGLPKWAEDARYDINAKVLDPPPENKTLSREQSIEMYRAKVRSILTERFGLRAHMETKILPVYDLVLLPGPLRFKETTAPPDKHGTNVRNRDMTGTGLSMQNLAAFLANLVERNVVDKTGLTADYDVTLKWSPDELAEAAKTTGIDDRPPDIYAALQEQLGLKLVSGKGPADALVVDKILPPGED